MSAYNRRKQKTADNDFQTMIPRSENMLKKLIIRVIPIRFRKRLPWEGRPPANVCILSLIHI